MGALWLPKVHICLNARLQTASTLDL